jgi:hypothetical protein
MFQRGVNEQDVRHILEAGEVIEEYPEDQPYPSILMLGWRGTRPLHVVIAHNQDEHEIIVITVYEPDPARWEPGFRSRRRS